MIMRNLATLVLLAAAILTSWLAWQLRPRPAPDVPGPPRSDYSPDNYELVVLDDTGRESFTVHGPGRKSVVEGKSVSVRVVLGGGRNIKKINKNHFRYKTT